jgi:hypothetical protein
MAEAFGAKAQPHLFERAINEIAGSRFAPAKEVPDLQRGQALEME